MQPVYGEDALISVLCLGDPDFFARKRQFGPQTVQTEQKIILPNFWQYLMFARCSNCDTSNYDVRIQITVTTKTVLLLTVHIGLLHCLLLE